MREWLNSDFLNAAFNEDEQNRLELVLVSADKNPKCSTDPGKDTKDRVFLLSIDEVNEFCSSDEERKCLPTQEAIAHEVFQGDSGNCWWWLRTPGDYSRSAAIVRDDGSILDYGRDVNYSYGGVRPVVVIQLK